MREEKDKLSGLGAVRATRAGALLGKAGLGSVGGFDVSLLTVIIIVPENDVRRGDAQTGLWARRAPSHAAAHHAHRVCECLIFHSPETIDTHRIEPIRSFPGEVSISIPHPRI